MKIQKIKNIFIYIIGQTAGDPHNKNILSKFGYRTTMTEFLKNKQSFLIFWRTAGNLLSKKKKKKKLTTK